MDVSFQKEIAAKMYGVGKERIWIDPTKIDEVSKALTKEDIRVLVEKGYIKVLQKKGQSRARARELEEKKKKGRRRGPGSRKGKKTARTNPKEVWMQKVRAQRKLLRILKVKGVIDRKLYRRLYRMVKGGFFRSKRHIILWLKDRGYIQ